MCSQVTRLSSTTDVFSRRSHATKAAYDKKQPLEQINEQDRLGRTPRPQNQACTTAIPPVPAVRPTVAVRPKQSPLKRAIGLGLDPRVAPSV